MLQSLVLFVLAGLCKIGGYLSGCGTRREKHLASGDVLGLLLAWMAGLLVRRQPSARYTYGWRKSSVLAAFLNFGKIFVTKIQNKGELLNLNPSQTTGGRIQQQPFQS